MVVEAALHRVAFDLFLAPPSSCVSLVLFPSEALIMVFPGFCFPGFPQAAPEPQSSVGEHQPGGQTPPMATHTSLDHPGRSFSPALSPYQVPATGLCFPTP